MVFNNHVVGYLCLYGSGCGEALVLKHAPDIVRELMNMFTIIFNPRPEGYGSSLVIHSFINPRPEGYGSRLVIHSFINPRPEGYGSRLVVRSFIHSVTWNCVHFYATTKARTRSPREYIAI